MSNQSNSAIVIASVILGASVAGGGWLIGSAVDSASGALSEALSDLPGAVASAPQQVARAAPPTPTRTNRPDPNRYYKVNTKGSPSRGESDAKIEVIEFSDFQCPFCARVYPTVKRIEEEYGENVRIVFKHLPLRIHSKAQDAHAAAEAAHRQGKFWEMHDKIFGNRGQLSDARYLTYAGELGLDALAPLLVHVRHQELPRRCLGLLDLDGQGHIEGLAVLRVHVVPVALRGEPRVAVG